MRKIMKQIVVKRGKEIIAKITDMGVELPSEFSIEGQLVRSIVGIGVPEPSHLENGRWRITVDDPDFLEALTLHLEQYGLQVEN